MELHVNQVQFKAEQIDLEIPAGADRVEWLKLVQSWLWSYGIESSVGTHNYGIVSIWNGRGRDEYPCGYGYKLRCWLDGNDNGRWSCERSPSTAWKVVGTTVLSRPDVVKVHPE